MRNPVRASDAHIHAILYFLTPEAFETDADRIPEISATKASEAKMVIKPSEISLIKRLAHRANVIPILGRSDCMTLRQLESAKDAVQSQLVEKGIVCSALRESLGHQPLHDSEPVNAGNTEDAHMTKSQSMLDTRRALTETEEPSKIVRTRSRSISRRRRTLAQSEAVLRALDPPVDLHAVLPLSFVAPEDWPMSPDSCSNKEAFLRRYRWATIDCTDPSSSDFQLIAKLLTETHTRVWRSCLVFRRGLRAIQALRDGTNKLYELFRMEKMLLAKQDHV